MTGVANKILTASEVQQAISAAVAAERARTASVADALADEWAATALKFRTDGLRRAWFGLGRAYVTVAADRDARVVEAAVHGLRSVARLIREGATRREDRVQD